MDEKKSIQEIRHLISEAEMEPAMDKTRQLLELQGNERLLVNLDLIESEFNHIKDQQLNGLLSADDQVRLYNINRAKLLELVLNISGEKELASALQFKAGGQDAAPSRSAQNYQFKNGLKMVFGILFFMGGAGMVMNKEPLVPCLLTALCGVVTFPPSLRLIEKLIRYELLSWQKYTIVFGAILLAGSILPKKDANQKVNTAIEQAADSIQ
jgi:hypothetical protein